MSPNKPISDTESSKLLQQLHQYSTVRICNPKRIGEIFDALSGGIISSEGKGFNKLNEKIFDKTKIKDTYNRQQRIKEISEFFKKVTYLCIDGRAIDGKGDDLTSKDGERKGEIKDLLAGKDYIIYQLGGGFWPIIKICYLLGVLDLCKTQEEFYDAIKYFIGVLYGDGHALVHGEAKTVDGKKKKNGMTNGGCGFLSKTLDQIQSHPLGYDLHGKKGMILAATNQFILDGEHHQYNVLGKHDEKSIVISNISHMQPRVVDEYDDSDIDSIYDNNPQAFHISSMHKQIGTLICEIVLCIHYDKIHRMKKYKGKDYYQILEEFENIFSDLNQKLTGLTTNLLHADHLPTIQYHRFDKNENSDGKGFRGIIKITQNDENIFKPRLGKEK